MMSPGDWRRLRALAEAVVTPIASLDEAGWQATRAAIAEALDSRPPGVVKQFRIFVALVYGSTWLLTGRSWTALDGAAREAYLKRFQDSPIKLMRLGFWGLRTMVCLGYYGREAVWPAVGYAPVSNGNEVVRARATL